MRKLFLKPPRCAILLGFFCIWARLNAQAVEPNDWKAYFPMSVGNEWQYYKQDFRNPANNEIMRWRIVSDSVVANQQYFKLIEDKFRYNGIPISSTMVWLGYDEQQKMVSRAQFQQEPKQVWWEQLPCNLNRETSEPFFCGESLAPFHFWRKSLGVYDSTKTFYSSWQFGPYATFEKHMGLTQIKTSPDLDDYWSIDMSFFKVYHPQSGFIWDGNKLVNNEQERNIAESLLHLYPNPVKDKLQIRGEEEVGSVIVYNLLGQVVIKEEGSLVLEKILDISGLNSGNYLVKITLNNGGTHQKLITKN